jgi:MoaA/NifB/PqqE/SkfB family radical SAM enzyme
MTPARIRSPRPGRDGNVVGDLVGLALWRWGRACPGHFVWVARRATHIGVQELRRLARVRRLGAPVPRVIAISPTMACNYNCQGCYSRGRPLEDELTLEELESIFTEAEDLGALSVVVTGGEPLGRQGLLGLIARHRRLLFVLITNGSLLSEGVAEEIGACGNVLTLVSIEGSPDDTDERRRAGAHAAALRALDALRDAGLCFGFAAMHTAANGDNLISDAFLDDMTRRGCSLGFVTEYVPTGLAPREDYLVAHEHRERLRRRVLELRERLHLVLVQFPHDEYGEDNVCTGAGRSSLHIGSTGDVEPCPFVPISCENVRDGGLTAACRSPFLREIRRHPHLLRRERHACALFEHEQELRQLAATQR